MLAAGLLREGESLYDTANIRLMHHLNAALRAHALYKRDVEYIVRGGEVIIVDEFTGRTMPGRRWSDGLHQAVEAKEGVRVREENQTVASITFQNYFRLYKKLSGMTGTADTEAPEFLQIYGLEVVVIPTHRPMIRKDIRTSSISRRRTSSKRSSRTSRTACSAGSRCWSAPPRSRPPSSCPACCSQEKVPHQVLNAKQHEREAHVIAQAGRPGHRHDRHQHGRPRYRHRAGRQPRGRTDGSPPEIDETTRAGSAHSLAAAARPGDQRRRPAHRRHRAPRVAPHRQSAARPFRPPGRSGLQPLLSVDGRQPDAHLRRSDCAPSGCCRWPA